ncbi:unnamed protein product, partial [Polarella glacialis]
VAGLWPHFAGWLQEGVAFEDASATDVLLMDLQWQKDQREEQLLAMVGQVMPFGALQATVKNAAAGARVPGFARFSRDLAVKPVNDESRVTEPRGIEQRLPWSSHG